MQMNVVPEDLDFKRKFLRTMVLEGTGDWDVVDPDRWVQNVQTEALGPVYTVRGLAGD